MLRTRLATAFTAGTAGTTLPKHPTFLNRLAILHSVRALSNPGVGVALLFHQIITHGLHLLIKGHQLLGARFEIDIHLRTNLRGNLHTERRSLGRVARRLRGAVFALDRVLLRLSFLFELLAALFFDATPVGQPRVRQLRGWRGRGSPRIRLTERNRCPSPAASRS